MDYRFFGLEKHQDRGMVRWCRSQVGKWVERIAAAGGFSKPLAQLAISLFEEPDLRQYLKEIRVRIQRPRRPEFSRFSDMDDVATQLENGLRSGRFGGDGVAVIREIVETSLLFMGPEPEPGDPDQIRGTLEELRDLFRLTAAEAEILLFFVVVDLHEPLRDYLGNRALPVLARTLSAAIPCELADAHRILHEDGRLRMLGLLGIREPRFAPFFEPGPGILDHLLGFSGTRFLDRLCKKDDGPVLPMDCFSLTLDERAILDGLVRSGQPFHLLIHGRAGTGKTELARTLVRQSGRGAWFVRQGKKGDREERKLGVEAALAVSAEDRGIVVVDEAESLISSAFGPFMGNTGEGKAWVNDFLDRRAGRMIWIVNDLDWVPESTRRRFTYSLPFRRFTRGQRANAWTQLAAGHPQEQALSPELLRDLTERYEVNAAGIATALDILARMPEESNATPAACRQVLEEALSKHAELTGARCRGKSEGVTPRFDLAALNTDIPAREILHGLQRIVTLAKARAAAPDGVNLLFWGPPGTGKTELAKYVARSLGKDLVVRRASDLLNPYVGVTESLIREAFQEAARDGAVLLIDEADSFLGRRENAQRSWEITHTNEFLTNLESHRGVVIACTNLLDGIDRAALRRFAWKVAFRTLTAEGALRTYRRYFPLRSSPWSTVSRDRLAAIDGLTFGDFRAVADRLALHARSRLRHEAVLEALANELAYRKKDSERPMGFAR